MFLLRIATWVIAGLFACGFVYAQSSPAPAQNAFRDTYSDTWVATDALRRTLPLHDAVGALRKDKTVAIFYFLWLHGYGGGPYDVSQILQKDPSAMTKPDSPLWGPLHAPHHWGESIFGYYRTDDAAVLRKHAQMLSDAGVDAIFFDVSNQLTYRAQYMELLRVFAEFKQHGGRPPKIAFICPFWNPAKVVEELYRDLYKPGLHSDLWFTWDGKPLILADPALINVGEQHSSYTTAAELLSAETLGQTFTAKAELEAIGAFIPTWRGTGSLTLTLYRDGPKGERIASQRFTDVRDNRWVNLKLKSLSPAGVYYLEMSEPAGRIGWWSHTNDIISHGQAFANGTPVTGDRTLHIVTSNETLSAMQSFFTFRKPQPDYFEGQTQPDMWSWLEVYPQHVFTNSAGVREQMSVGVAQNAVGNRLGSMSEPGARGRSFHAGKTETAPGAIRLGHNVTEQWERALKEDPLLIFITGWNEWIAGRFAEFNGVRLPVMFVDQFDQEHSRDIEPMRGGHGDDYYYQMVSNIRRYKGARPIPRVQPAPITIDGKFDDWASVQPEFRDTVGDPVHRRHPGWNSNVTYVNDTGRNDVTTAKVSYDKENIYFYVETREPLTSSPDTNWILLFIDLDGEASTGWLGYDFIVNRTNVTTNTTTIEANVNGKYKWGSAKTIRYAVSGKCLEVVIPLFALNLKKMPSSLDFKWADNIQQTGEWSDFTLNGDAAPNDRFNYRAVFR